MKRIILALAFLSTAFGQRVAAPYFNMQYFDNSGDVCNGCKLYTYLAGGTTNTTTYQTPAGTANSQPITLNSAGRANLYLTPGVSYRFDLYTSGNVLLGTWDNQLASSLAGTATVTANYVYAGPATGAAAIPTFRAMVAADLPVTTCTNQFLRATATCASVVAADFGSSVAARSALVRANAAVGVSAFGTTIDVLAYQVAEIPAFVFVATDFTTSGVGTALETITGLTWTIPASTVLNTPFACHLIYHQNVATDAVAFGLQDVTISPTNINASGQIYTNTTAVTQGNVVGLTTTTATNIVGATPSAITTNWVAEINGMIEAPSNASSSAIRIMVSTATAADTVTVKRGSWCRLN